MQPNYHRFSPISYILCTYSRNKTSHILKSTLRYYGTTQWRALGLRGSKKSVCSWDSWIVKVETGSRAELVRMVLSLLSLLSLLLLSFHSVNKLKSPLPKEESKTKQNQKNLSSQVSWEVWWNFSEKERRSKLLCWEICCYMSPSFFHQSPQGPSSSFHWTALIRASVISDEQVILSSPPCCIGSCRSPTPFETLTPLASVALALF